MLNKKQTYKQSRIWESVMHLVMNCDRPFNINISCWICGSHSGDYEKHGLLGCNVVEARSFGGPNRLHLQSRKASQIKNQLKQAVSSFCHLFLLLLRLLFNRENGAGKYLLKVKLYGVITQISALSI